MIGKVIGTAIIGLVLSIGSASLAKYQVEEHNQTNYRRSIAKDVVSGKIGNEYLYNTVYDTNIYHSYDATAVYKAFLYLGILLSIIFIQHKISTPKVFLYMAYSLFFATAIGFVLGFYNAYDDYTHFESKRTIYQNFNDDYLKNCTYTGLGFAALIFGIHLATKKPNT